MEGKWIKESYKGKTIVWVHGFLSSGDSCWQKTGCLSWPDLISQEKDINNFGNYVVTYHTDIFSGKYTIDSIVQALYDILKIDNVLNSKHIVFICHSMGGIVVRKFLVKRELQLQSKKISLFLIASPSLGAKYAQWFKGIARIMGHSHALALQPINKNPWLYELHTDFLTMKDRSNIIVSGRELIEAKFFTLKWFWFIPRVVSPVEGVSFFGEPIEIPETDHFSIAKPTNKDSFQHKLLVKFLQELNNINSNNSKGSGVLTGDTVLDSVTEKLFDLDNNKIVLAAEIEYIKILRELFNRPEFYPAENKIADGYTLFTICKTRLILEKYKNKFKNPNIRDSIQKAIGIIIELEEIIVKIYGVSFSINAHLSSFTDIGDFVKNLPLRIEKMQPFIYSEKIKDIKKHLKNAELII